MNYFELFALPVSPVADKAAAAKKYFELQKKFHPDFFTNENEAEKEGALERSAAVNKAYAIFQNPDKTLEYFLQTKGMITSDEKYALPPDFLMEMMELNETLDDADESSMRKRVDEYENELLSSVKPLLDTSKASTLSSTELEELKSFYYRKKYLKRILDRFAD